MAWSEGASEKDKAVGEEARGRKGKAESAREDRKFPLWDSS